MTHELEQFVASLAIPADRKAVVLAELRDHVACAAETAIRAGRDPDAAARAALGDLEGLRGSLETIEPAFAVSRGRAIARGVAAAVLVAIAIDQLGAVLGLASALVAIGIVAVLAPPRALDLLRAELRAPRIAGALGIRGVPIGPAIAYAITVACGPFLVWIALLVARGACDVDVPRSAFAVVTAVYALLLVEGLRARRRAVA